MDVNLDITDPAIKSKLAVLPTKMLDHAFETLLAQAHLIVGLAQIYCPVETGSLRDSIRVERGGAGMFWREVKVRAGGYITNPKTGRIVNYAKYQELGTRYIIGSYFLSQAIAEVQPTIQGAIKSNVLEAIKT
jgi:hypothetical protein